MAHSSDTSLLTLSPAQRLPTNVIQRILFNVLAAEERTAPAHHNLESRGYPVLAHPWSLLGYARLCRQWRQAIQGEPCLWSVLIIVVDDNVSAERLVALGLALKYSASELIQITIIVRLSPEHDLYPSILRDTMQLLAVHSPRWHTFILRSRHFPCIQWRPISISQLIYLEVDSEMDKGHIFLTIFSQDGSWEGIDGWLAALTDTDMLRRYGRMSIIAGAHSSPINLLPIPWKELSSFRVEHEAMDAGPTLNDWGRTLGATPAVQDLGIVYRSAWSLPAQISPGPVLRAPALVRLRLACSTAGMRDLLVQTSFPHLNLLYLESRDRDQRAPSAAIISETNAAIMGHHTPTLRHAILVFVREEGAIWVSWMRAVPTLETLSVHGLAEGGAVAGDSLRGDRTIYIGSPSFLEALASGVLPVLRWLRLGPSVLQPGTSANSALVRMIQERCLHSTMHAHSYPPLNLDVTSRYCDEHYLNDYIHLWPELGRFDIHTNFVERPRACQDVARPHVDIVQSRKYSEYDPAVEGHEMERLADAKRMLLKGAAGSLRWWKIGERRPTSDCVVCRMGIIGWDFYGSERDSPDALGHRSDIDSAHAHFFAPVDGDTSSVSSGHSGDSLLGW
ncbi:hypothetical protein BD626DRAFT_414089 [Schizophyllum amplum]|uniref:Uncharacterized protein n=1 Tax=Schizophyllum amplum TaxID=97359 RepID=A0A550BUY8_9AGAR|nr:hypothetical protein BD626DRAFT_414089 [Auriculariopsis ampla]